MKNSARIIAIMIAIILFSSPSEAQQQDTSKGVTLQDLIDSRDAAKGKVVVPQDIGIAKPNQWKPVDAAPSIQRVEEQSSFDKGRFDYQDRDQYIAERKKEYIVEKGMLIGMGIMIIAIIVYFLTGGLGKTLTK